MNRTRDTAAVAIVYLAWAVLWASPASLSPHDAVHDLGDPLQVAHVMAWNTHQLARGPLDLFNANGFYPYSQSLTFSDHLLPESLQVAPVFWLTGNAVLGPNESRRDARPGAESGPEADHHAERRGGTHPGHDARRRPQLS